MGFSVWSKNPESDSTEIDFNTMRVVFPFFVMGTYFGELTSNLLPKIVMVVILTLLLSFIVIKSLKKGLKMWKEEEKTMQDRLKTSGKLSNFLNFIASIFIN